MKSVLITGKLVDTAAEQLRNAGCQVDVHDGETAMSPEQFREAAGQYDAMITLLSDKIDAALLQSGPRTRVFANYAVGFDNMDVEAATRAGIALCNTPDVLTAATAEIAWALLFAVARRVSEGDRLTRAGLFKGWRPLMLLGHEVGGKTLGIIGAGRIGTAMARRALGFDMDIVYTRRSGRSAELDSMGAKLVGLDDLLRESDYISIHAPLNESTRHMISDAQFALMKPSAVIINTGRGPVIDEKALVRALQQKKIWGAGLDVYEREPAIEPELLTMDNVVLAPHIGSATYEAREKMAALAAENILDFFAGKVPRTCINPDYVKFAE